MTLTLSTKSLASPSGNLNIGLDGSGNATPLSAMTDETGALIKTSGGVPVAPAGYPALTPPSVAASQTAYAANTVLGTVMTITGVVKANGGTADLLGASLHTTVQNLSGIIDAFVFDAAPTGSYSDGAAFALSSGDLALRPKVIHIDDWISAGTGGSIGQSAIEARPFINREGTTSLYVVLVTRAALPSFAGSTSTLGIQISPNAS